MLAGAPPSKFPGNRPNHDELRIHIWDRDTKYYSKYLIDLCVPWSGESRLLFERSATSFCLFVNEWNRKSATFIERQWYHFCQISYPKDIVAVIMKPQLLHGGNKMPTGGKKKNYNSTSAKSTTPIDQTKNLDDEAAGKLSYSDLHRIITAALEGRCKQHTSLC